MAITLSASGAHPLAPSTQTRNLLLFAGCTALQYLAAPVGYVGITQASLCHELNASNAVANLPEMAFLSMTFMPVIFAWLSPRVDQLRYNLVFCYSMAALSQVLVGIVLLLPVSSNIKILAIIGQAATAGMMVPSAIAFLWEAVGRGAEEKRRGQALSLAFGLGPLFAVAGSLAADLLLTGEMGGLRVSPLPVPANFALLYLLAAPTMILAALLSWLFVVPPPAVEFEHRSFGEAVFGGLWAFLSNPLLLTATVVTVLLYSGNTIVSNLNLYSKEVFGDAPMLHAGSQLAMRFACKSTAGLLLGWLLMRTNPRTGLVVTGLIFVTAVVWAVFATTEWYFMAFWFYGAGELVGVYAPNYILSASREADMRRNMAFVTMMMVPAAPTGYLFGRIADVYGHWYGMSTGFRLSFAACAALMLLGIVLAVTRLPARPRASPVAGTGG